MKITAINFDKIFLDTEQIAGGVLKKGIHLPPNIFEDIQHKGREIGWPIPSQFLKPCLSCRDNLSWVNVNLLHGHYLTEDLVKVANSKLPLKEFSFRSYRFSPQLCDVIKEYSHSIEMLQIGFRNTKEMKKSRFNNEYLGHRPVTFPRLKKLSIDFSVLSSCILMYLDVAACSETLEAIELIHFGTDFGRNSRKEYFERCNNNFLKIFHELKVLKSFTVYDLKCPFIAVEFKHLKNLRDDIKFIKQKNLKYLGIINGPDETLWPTYIAHVEKYAQTVGACRTVDLLLTNIEYSIYQCSIPPIIIRHLIRKIKINPVTNSNWQRIEKVIVVLIEKYWTDGDCDFMNLSRVMFEIADTLHTWNVNFLKKFVNLSVNFGLYEKDMEGMNFIWIFDVLKSHQILDFMLNHIMKNPNSTTSKFYLNHLILSNAYQNTTIEALEFVELNISIDENVVQAVDITNPPFCTHFASRLYSVDYTSSSLISTWPV